MGGGGVALIVVVNGGGVLRERRSDIGGGMSGLRSGRRRSGRMGNGFIDYGGHFLYRFLRGARGHVLGFGGLSSDLIVYIVCI